MKTPMIITFTILAVLLVQSVTAVGIWKIYNKINPMTSIETPPQEIASLFN
jgi:hypothetical protein